MPIRSKRCAWSRCESLECRSLFSEIVPVTGHAFADLNGDGRRESNEPGIPGVRVYLAAYGETGFRPGDQSTRTDRNGDYVLRTRGLNDPGAYIGEIPPARYGESFPVHNAFQVVNLAVGQPPPVGVNFGNAPLSPNGSISGKVLAGGQGVSDWQVFIDENRNGQFDASDPSVFTDDNGKYSFTGLKPGSYRVGDIVLPGWHQRSPAVVGGTTYQDLGGTGFNDATVVAWRTNSNVNFRVQRVTVGRLIVSIFDDKNGDGKMDLGETARGIFDTVQLWMNRVDPSVSYVDVKYYDSTPVVWDNLDPGLYDPGEAPLGVGAPFIETTHSTDHPLRVRAGRTTYVLIGYKHT